MDSKEAFKVGFVTKLASHGISVSDLMDSALLLEKRGFNPVPLVATGLGLSVAPPFFAGKGVGGVGAALAAEDVESAKETRKRYMLKQLRDLINARKAEIENQLITQAKVRARGGK